MFLNYISLLRFVRSANLGRISRKRKLICKKWSSIGFFFFYPILRNIFFSFSENPGQELYLCPATCKQTWEQCKPPSAGYWFWWSKCWLSRIGFFFFFLTGGIPDLSLGPSPPGNELYPQKSTENLSKNEDLWWETLGGRRLAIWWAI